MIKYRVVKFLEMAQGDYPSVIVAYYASVNSKNVVRCVRICKSFNTIVRGVFTQHYIYLDKKIDYDIKKMIHEANKYEFENSDEMKILVICLHNIAKGHSPYIFVCGHPRTYNEKNTFGDAVAKACLNA